jgi:hypothetical protein
LFVEHPLNSSSPWQYGGTGGAEQQYETVSRSRTSTIWWQEARGGVYEAEFPNP